ncbi:MAG: MarR family transcriptional regulator [Pseudomonadota bacterium]
MLEDEIALLLDRLLRHAHSSLHRRAQALRKDGLLPSDAVMLITLADIEPTPAHALAVRLARHKSQVTRSVQKLEAKGLITRSDLADDGRVRVLRLSPKGRAAARTLRQAVVDTLRDVLAPLPHEDRCALRDILKTALDDDDLKHARKDPAA